MSGTLFENVTLFDGVNPETPEAYKNSYGTLFRVGSLRCATLPEATMAWQWRCATDSWTVRASFMVAFVSPKPAATVISN